MPKYPENLIHFCRPVLENYELDDETPRMFVRSMLRVLAFVRYFYAVFCKQMVVSAGIVRTVSVDDALAVEDQGFAFLQVICVILCFKDFGLSLKVSLKKELRLSGLSVAVFALTFLVSMYVCQNLLFEAVV